MEMNSDAARDSSDRQWYVVGRWQEYEGEARAMVQDYAARQSGPNETSS